MAQHPELENNLTKASLNQAVLRRYTKLSETPESAPFHDDESAIDPIPMNESRRAFPVPASTKPHPSFVPGSYVYMYYAQPIETRDGVTKKDTTLPGIRYFGGQVQLDEYTAPFRVLVIEPDMRFTGDQCGTVIAGLTDDELRSYWKGIGSGTPEKASHSSVPRDTYPPIGNTSLNVIGHLLISRPPRVFLNHKAEMEQAMLDGDEAHPDRSVEQGKASDLTSGLTDQSHP